MHKCTDDGVCINHLKITTKEVKIYPKDFYIEPMVDISEYFKISKEEFEETYEVAIKKYGD